MKIATLLGTRPEIIRLTQVVKVLDGFSEHVLIHTGQNYDPDLSDVFFKELDLRQPDFYLGVRAIGFASQVGQILQKSAEVLERVKPDRLLILGDTNSGLAAIVAARMGVPVYHMEAGNRCYDSRVPEEVNRRIIDHCSDVLMPYTHRSKENLIREGIPRHRVFVTGNPILEVLNAFEPGITASTTLERLGLREQQYFLVTLHRAENVDRVDRLDGFLSALSMLADKYEFPLVVSVHPRTADRMQQAGLAPASGRVRLLKPLGFFDFVRLEKSAFCVLSDSGTVQEECSILRVPNVTLRDVTERPETVECGSNIVTGADTQAILSAVALALEAGNAWHPPLEYTETRVSMTVAKILLSHRETQNCHP